MVACGLPQITVLTIYFAAWLNMVKTGCSKVLKVKLNKRQNSIYGTMYIDANSLMQGKITLTPFIAKGSLITMLYIKSPYTAYIIVAWVSFLATKTNSSGSYVCIMLIDVIVFLYIAHTGTYKYSCISVYIPNAHHVVFIKGHLSFTLLYDDLTKIYSKIVIPRTM